MMDAILLCFSSALFASSVSGGATKLSITCPSFPDGKSIPTKYANKGVAGGSNISPPLFWTGVPEGTRSLVLAVVDIHPIANSWVHWLILNMPAGTTGLPEGASGKKMPPGTKELYNSFGEMGYGGPQPPKGSGPHSYVVTVYALSAEKLDLTANASLTAFRKAVEGKVLASASLTGIYER